MNGEEHTAAQDREGPVKRPPWWKRFWGWTEFGKKSGWQWLELLSALAIPVVLAVAGYWFSAQQDQRQQAVEDRRAESAQKVEEQRAQDAVLQAYLDQIGQLMLEKDLRNSAEDSEVRTLARARTLAALGRLDVRRKMEVLRFLIEADLVQGVNERKPIIGLGGADLSGADLREDDLAGADLSGAVLHSADLTSAALSGADLSGADLREAHLRYAVLRDAVLRDAVLRDADLRPADLSGADLSGADLSGADLGYAVLPDTDLSSALLLRTNLDSADLSGADLKFADLPDAVLHSADLSGADLRWAYVIDADLSGADLREAEGMSNEELERQAKTLKGATMPDGSIHP
jgi:uncharacterized protein YjbI with pentapeptide repeats